MNYNRRCSYSFYAFPSELMHLADRNTTRKSANWSFRSNSFGRPPPKPTTTTSNSSEREILLRSDLKPSSLFTDSSLKCSLFVDFCAKMNFYIWFYSNSTAYILFQIRRTVCSNLHFYLYLESLYLNTLNCFSGFRLSDFGWRIWRLNIYWIE